jgi:hypothetical protein
MVDSWNFTTVPLVASFKLASLCGTSVVIILTWCTITTVDVLARLTVFATIALYLGAALSPGPVCYAGFITVSHLKKKGGSGKG